MSKPERDEYYELNPDAFTRFHVCKELLAKNFDRQKINLLDVGGGSQYFRTALLRDKLPYQLTVIDILPPPMDVDYQYVQGDATKMDFADNSFDAVVSMDVLEHVSDNRKPNFIQECYRVAKDLVIIAAPFESAEVTQAETIANDFFKGQHHRDHPWLIEHFEQNKPTATLMERELKKLGCSYIRFESNNLPAWLRLILANFTSEALIDPNRVREINSFYNQNLLKLNDFTEPGYRHFYVLYKNPQLKKDFKQYFQLEPSASDQLIIEQKMIELFTDKLKLAHEAELTAAAVIDQLTINLENANQGMNELRKTLESIQLSKAYKLARGLGDLRRKITPNT